MARCIARGFLIATCSVAVLQVLLCRGLSDAQYSPEWDASSSSSAAAASSASATSAGCGPCDRQPGACRRVAGLYTVAVLRAGTYNPVVDIPPQACAINVTELARSQNYLAVKTDKGDNVLNSEWSIVSPGNYPGAGTNFTYDRGVVNCPGECLTSTGRTNRRVIVQLLYYNKNPGVAYSFLLPNDVHFLPFQEIAPHQGNEKLTNHKPQSLVLGSTSKLDPGIKPLNPESYNSGGRDSWIAHEEPHTGPTQDQKREVDVSSISAPSDLYNGTSYGSHMLGGRGQSFILHHSSSSKDEEPAVPSGPERDGSRSSGSRYSLGDWGRDPAATRPDHRHAGTRTQNPEHDRSKGRTSTLDRSRGPASSRQPSASRQHGEPLAFSYPSSSYFSNSHTASLHQRVQPPTYISAYDRARGQESLTGGSTFGRASLVDRTYSRSVEQDFSNQLPNLEHVGDRGPPLAIATGGGGGGEYVWTISGFSECSLTCGGGFQETQIVCVLTSASTQVVVTPENCENALKPRTQRVPCNNDPCQPSWVTGEWSTCSVTCGGGMQSRRVECRQRVTTSVELSISASQCEHEQKPAVAQQCNNQPCSQWNAGPWGKCNAECAGGERERLVMCVDGKGVQIPASYCSEAKPSSKERCNTQPCDTQWLHSYWSDQCSTSCGSGTTSRQVMCSDRLGRPVAEDSCNKEHKPRDRKRCESNVRCGSSWFTGSWSECSESCGHGKKSRPVVCVKRETGGQMLTLSEDDQCSPETKPATEEPCTNSQCGAQFYMTAWSPCSVTCGNGVRTRSVRCIDDKQLPSRLCDQSLAPKEREVCKLPPCPDDQRVQEGKSRAEETAEKQQARLDSDCRDVFWNCQIVVQARLCHLYGYYRNVCCRSCQKVL